MMARRIEESPLRPSQSFAGISTAQQTASVRKKPAPTCVRSPMLASRVQSVMKSAASRAESASDPHSSAMVPRGVVPVAALFMLIGIGLLFVPGAIALQWWIPAATFGLGQIAVGAFVLRERAQKAEKTL